MISPVQCSQTVNVTSSTLPASDVSLPEEDVHRRLGSLLLHAVLGPLEGLEDGTQVLPCKFDHLLSLLGLALSLPTAPTLFLIDLLWARALFCLLVRRARGILSVTCTSFS